VTALRDAALSYAARGWRIFPLHGIVNGACTCGRTDCPSPGKHPLVRRGLYDATTDEILIRSWWRGWRRANVGVVTGFEALIRWHHPVHGLVDPTTFIGIAEENGLIGPIGAWVLDKAFADAQEWTRSADRPLTVGVNVSGRQLTDGALLDQVCRLRTDRASDVQLVLEITESVLVGDDEQSVSVLRALRELGVRLAIDDFGTGYSSIGYLHHLPVDILKIDRSFVGGIALGGRVAALVEAILAMGRSLDLRMVAEGIEDIRQVAALRGIGCELGQGFLFARPMPADQVNAFLAASPVDVSPEVSRLAVRPHMGAPAVRTHG